MTVLFFGVACGVTTVRVDAEMLQANTQWGPVSIKIRSSLINELQITKISAYTNYLGQYALSIYVEPPYVEKTKRSGGLFQVQFYHVTLNNEITALPAATDGWQVSGPFYVIGSPDPWNYADITYSDGNFPPKIARKPHAYYLRNAHVGTVLVIRGNIANRSDNTINSIQINGSLITKSNLISQYKYCFNGGALTDGEIKSLTLIGIGHRTCDAFGDVQVARNIPPRGVRPFTIVFGGIPRINTIRESYVRIFNYNIGQMSGLTEQSDTVVLVPPL